MDFRDKKKPISWLRRLLVSEGPSLICLMAGLLVLLMLLPVMGTPDLQLEGAKGNWLLWPGFFLFESFSWAALYLPIYFFLNALVFKHFNIRQIILLIFSLFPFFTLALFFKQLFKKPLSEPIWLVDLSSRLGEDSLNILLAIIFFMQVILLVGIEVAARRNPLKKNNSRFVVLLDEGKWGKRSSTAFPNFIHKKKKSSLTLKLASPRRAAQARLLPLKTGQDSEELLIEAHIFKDEQPQPPKAEARSEKPLLNESSDEKQTSPRQESGRIEQIPLSSSNLNHKDKAINIAQENGLSQRITRHVEQDAKEQTALLAKGKEIKDYQLEVGKILKDYQQANYRELDQQTRLLAETLRHTLAEFNIKAEVTGIQKGPVITMFEILPDRGVKLSKIVNLADNIALRLAASRVRIVAPIPGKQAVGIEVPNKQRLLVSLKEVVLSKEFQESDAYLPLVLGKDITGNVVLADLSQMPHLLIAGATGSGKSVCVNSIICSILLKKSPAEAKLILIDPKIVELKFYNDIPHLLTPVITDPKKAYQALQYCLTEMERRYALLDALGARDIYAYNRKLQKKNTTALPMPQLIIIIDEFADLMATTGREMESALARLAAMSRAVGIHIVLATQRPSIDVITGLIKANIPARIAFMVASKFDSRIIIDTVGAEKLLGQGDMLFLSAQDPFPRRIQGAFVSDEEVEALVNSVKAYGKPEYIDEEIFIEEDQESFPLGEDDPLYEKALEIVFAAGKASTSYIQRKLKIGYNRAARLVEEMEQRGIVGPAVGSKAREILHFPFKK